MKNAVFFPTLGLLLLAGCTQQVVMGGTAAAVYLTKPSSPTSSDTSYRMPEHQTWCYRTMADPQCYTSPQDVPPGRLINVDPPELYPLTAEAYSQELAERREAATKATENPEKLLPTPDSSSSDSNDVSAKAIF